MLRRTRIAGLLSILGISALGVAVAAQSDNTSSVAGTATTPGNIRPPARKAPADAPVLTPEEELKTFSLPPGYHAELVASEPMLESPTIIDFDPDGRLWALELKGFLPDMSGRDSMEPINDVVVLEDTDNDGKMDKRTVFADQLVMPRALKVLDHGVLVGEPPNLWLMKDTNGDLKADTKDLIASTYGNRNGGIEHNANGTLWAMDNIMYSSEHTWNLRYKDGKIESVPTLSRGQWQGSQDDAGRVYRNVNDSPVFVDYTPPHYFLRNPDAARTRGLYELLIEQADATIYPVRPNRGVNRGYRDPFFRPDGSSIVIQGAGTPTVYRGDKYPAAIRGNVFITDSPTNLVHAMRIVDDGMGRLSAKNTFTREEFFASSDERCRPVNLFSAPDGNMYVVDMYRGVVQAGGIWSEYLTEYIKTHDLQMPAGHARIWRIVYGTGPSTRGPKPALSTATPAQLVQTLSHPNGWWRDTAQRLLVERGDKSVVPSLTSLAATAPDWRTRLHALWTLDGLDAIQPASVEKAIADANPDVRAAGVRLSERWLGDAASPLAPAILKLATDRNWNVRRQVAASIGELPAQARVAPAIAMLRANGRDQIIVDAVLSGLKGVENDVLKGVIQTPPATAGATPRPATPGTPNDAVSMLVAAITKSGDVALVQQILQMSTDTARPAWERLAMLQGMDAVLPAAAGRGGRGGGGRGLAGLAAPGGRVTVTPGKPITLTAEPTALMALAKGTGALADVATSVSNKLDWPNRPAPVVVVAPLTAEQQKRYQAGAQIYKNLCLGCHQEDGRGKDKVGANLVDSAFVNSPDPTATIRIVLGGKEGPIGLMPPLASTFTDEQIAAALTYIRHAWGHTATPVDPLNVMEVRGLTKGRTTPWTDAELQASGRGGRGGGGGRAGGRGAGRAQ